MTSRPATTDHAVHDLIKARWSPRAFSAKPVPTSTLRSLFEAARWSASSYNEQPWRMIVATSADPAAHAAMLACLLPKNQEWAKAAPVLVIVVMKTHFTHHHSPNRVALYDCGAAAAQLTFEATAHGLVVHQMAGIDQDACRKAYSIPEGFEAVTALAIGFEGDAASLPQWARDLEHSPRTRKPLREIVFAGRFGAAAPEVG